MSEYLSKKAVLEWLDDRRYKSPWIESFRERLESGAFDVDQAEVQRMRAALVKIKQLLDEDRENDGAFQSWNHMQAWMVATQALYATIDNAREKVGTEEWWHKHYGAEWPKVEGDWSK